MCSEAVSIFEASTINFKLLKIYTVLQYYCLKEIDKLICLIIIVLAAMAGGIVQYIKAKPPAAKG